MLKVSDAFNSAFAAPDRELRARVTIGKTVYDSDDLTSINYDSGAMTGEQFSIGSTYMNSAKIIFSHLVEGLKQLDEVLVELGVLKPDGTVEYVKMGTFIVDDKIQMDRNNNTTTIECMDRMTMLGGTYVSKLTYPARIKDVAIEIANMAGVKANETSFARLSENKINQPTGYTYRDAIGLIAQFQMGFALFDRDGLLDIRTLQDNSFKIDPNQYFLKGLVKNETFFKLNGISCTVVTTSKDENGNETSKTTVLQSGSSSGAQIKLANNVMTQDVLDRMYEALKFTNYYPFSLNWNGNPAVEAGDWLTVEDLQGNEFKVPNMSYTLTYNGGLTTTSKADTSVSSPATYSYGGSMSNIVNEIGGREGAEGNHIYEGTEDQKPLFPKEGDLWYKHVGPDTEEWIYKDGKWEFLTSTKTANDAADAADKASKEAEEAKKQANKAVDGANDAVAKAGFANETATQAKSDAAAAGQQAKDALANAKNALTNSSGAQADANTAKANATQAVNDAATAKGQATNALGQANTAIGNALTALNKVNGMSVGGTNLIPNSSTPQVLKRPADNPNYPSWVGRKIYSGLKNNETYTFSAVAKAETTDKSAEQWGIRIFQDSGNHVATATNLAANTGKRQSLTFTTPDDGISYDVWVYAGGVGVGYTPSDLKIVVTVSDYKLETGTMATDWSPAPEDVQQQFTDINGELSQKVSQTTYNTLAGTVDTVSTLAKQNQSTIGTLATKTSVDTVNKTATTAQTLAQQNANELLNKASTNTVNTLTQRVTTAESTLSQTATKAELQVAQTNVDNLKKTVTSNTAGMTANANAIKLKADSSTVSDLDGRVTSLSGQLDVQSDLISAKVTASDVTGMLGNYATQTWTQSQIKSTADSINLSVSKVQTNLDNMQIGSRNYMKNSSTPVKVGVDWGTDRYVILPTYLTEAVGKLTFSAKISDLTDNTSGKISIGMCTPNNANIGYGTRDVQIVDSTLTVTFDIPSDMSDRTCIYIYGNSGTWDGSATGHLTINDYKLERGNKATDWTPAPEDMATEVQFSQLQLTVNGIQGTVQNKADQSQITQLADQITSVVGDVSANSSQITQMKADINLRVQKGDVVNQINISPEGILIDGQKVHITGQTTIDNAVIKDAMIADIKADKITAGTLNAANVNVINLNANNITTGTIRGANLSLNLNTGEVLFQKGSIKSTNGNLNIDINDGSMAVLNGQDGFYFKNGKLSLSSDWAGNNLFGESNFGSIEYSHSLFGSSGMLVRGNGGLLLGTNKYKENVFVSKVVESGISITPKGVSLQSEGTVSILAGTKTTDFPIYSPPFILVGTDGDGTGVGNRIKIYAEYVHIPSAYRKTASGSANVIVAQDGALVRSTSASKYKTDIIRSNIPDYGDKLLELPTATWMDIAETKRYRDDPVNQVKPTRNFGMIAEDLADAGLEMLVVRGADGELEGINYDRIGPALIPVIAKLKNEVEILKQKLEEKTA